MHETYENKMIDEISDRKTDLVNYIADLTAEMEAISDREGLHQLRDLLNLAKREAKRVSGLKNI